MYSLSVQIFSEGAVSSTTQLAGVWGIKKLQLQSFQHPHGEPELPKKEGSRMRGGMLFPRTVK